MDFINIAALPVLLIDAIFSMQNINYKKKKKKKSWKGCFIQG